ncbi:unnamed protein product [Peronospora belbahrii]|uniref:Rho-GAP domain-containing protein n=1 Tax=Peronospora belbahrii TaxID=622444 RepID=A0AAU9KNG8_9STRA|nr:unnamed protein product [Peronospora belbahrii]CAH0514868.1 unnamed protein product [Peronospora belbahrii]
METRSSPSMWELHAIAHERGLKYYMHLSKPDLFSLLQRKEGGGGLLKPVKDANKDTMRLTESSEATITRSSERLSLLKKKRKTRENDKAEDMRDKKKAKMVINTLDPIMLAELGPHTFEFTRTNGSVVVYNVESLVQYILATGDFSEPETRIPFSDKDLCRIDIEASKAKLNEKSVVEAMKNKHTFEEEKVKRDGILGLERCASEYVNKMLEIVESDDPEEGEMLLIMNVFPSFSDNFEQIRRNDSEYARHSMSHFIQYMKGPKNRPTVDQSGLLPVILGFLEDVAKGKQGASAFGF